MHRLFNSAAERVMCNLRHRLFSHLMNQEIGFYDRIRTGELMNRLSEVTTGSLPQSAMHNDDSVCVLLLFKAKMPACCTTSITSLS